MKNTIVLLLTLMLVLSCSESEKQSEQAAPEGSGEKTYYVGLIRPGATWTAEVTPELEKLQEAHLDNIQRLADSGWLALAGPTWADSGYSYILGLFFFETEDIQQAKKLTATDPSVQARRLNVQIHPWVGSSGLKYDEPVEMTAYEMVIYYKGVNWSSVTEPDFDSLRIWQAQELQKFDFESRPIISGPFEPSINAEAPSSMFIYKTDSLAWLEAVVSSALPVRRGILDPVVLHFYGPVGLREEPYESNQELQ
ncbi:MAG: YciI family protein [bacterium]|nr:YciI family protein [bacterium]